MPMLECSKCNLVKETYNRYWFTCNNCGKRNYIKHYKQIKKGKVPYVQQTKIT